MTPRAAARAGGVYEIRVEGQLDALWQDWFEGMILTSLPGAGQALLRGPVRDQAALHGLLARVRDLNLVLIAVQRLEETD